MTCPACLRDAVNTRLVVENYEYEDGRTIPRRAGTVRVVIPVRECMFCGHEWTDGAADVARSHALRKVLNEGDDDVRF